MRVEELSGCYVWLVLDDKGLILSTRSTQDKADAYVRERWMGVTLIRQDDPGEWSATGATYLREGIALSRVARIERRTIDG